MTERVPESDCDTPCQNGADDTAGASSTMCGGAWRNSVYALSTNYWESPGYDDRGWQSAADLGPNGVAPWYHRPNIADTANWIWSTDAGFNGGYDQTPGAGRVQIDPDGTHHNGGYDYGHIDSPGMESTDEYGNCFLRSNCNVDQMTTGNHWGSYPAWDVYIKSEGDPDAFTPFRPYLAHFFPENSRLLRVFTVSPRRFQRAQNRNPGPRDSGRGTQTPFRRPS